MTTLFLDVETTPTSDPGLVAEIVAGIKPPATYKKPESIAAWMATDGEVAAAEAVARTALDASAGELVCIGLARDDAEAPTILVRDIGDPDGERGLLRRFYALVDGWLEPVTDAAGRTVFADSPFFIAHNAAFDLGFIWRRAVVLGCHPTGWRLPTPNARSGKDYGCTMAAWAGYRERIGLARLCLALGLPDPKQGEDGAFAWQWWKAGDLDRLRQYNARDVEACRAIWHRLNGGAA